MKTITKFLPVIPGTTNLKDKSYAEAAWHDIEDAMNLCDVSGTLADAQKKVTTLHPKFKDAVYIKITIEECEAEPNHG